MSVSRLVACVELITRVLLTRASSHMYTAVLHADVQNDILCLEIIVVVSFRPYSHEY